MNSHIPQNILVLGDYRHCLTVIRSLTKVGHRIVMGQSKQTRHGKYSRFTSEVWNHPDIRETGKHFMLSLVNFLKNRQDISLIIPIGDTETGLLAKNLQMIPAYVRLVMPDPQIVETCHNKENMCQVIKKIGIPQLPFKKVYDLQELRQSADEFGYPCIIRPVDQFTRILNEKVLICHTQDQLETSFQNWPVVGKPLIIQKYATGPRHNLYFLACRGTFISSIEVKIIRTDRLDDTGLAVDIVSVKSSDSIHDSVQKLLTYFNYTGLGCAQFIVNDDGKVECFLEINPRLGAAFALTYACGIDLPKMAVDLTLNRLESLPKISPDYPEGVRFAWTLGDINGLQHSIGLKQTGIKGSFSWLGRIMLSFFYARVHPTWSWNDPIPTFVIYLKKFISLMRSVLKRCLK
ncbi:MAG: hypothetical protein GY781_12380 [Gammaproteobacteria bacterium]|nr:hypothetical protein [Gammaproteobacteria bacterium]